MILFGYLMVVLVSCASNTTSPTSQTPTSPPTPKPTKVPAGTVLFQADFSKLTDWKHTGGWKAVNGYLQSDLSDDQSITIPYKPTVDDYAIELQVQVVSVPKNGGFFMITADPQPGKDGYQARIVNMLAPGEHGWATHPTAECSIDPDANNANNLKQIDYEPSQDWRTYRVEVHEQQVFFFAQDSRVSFATSAQSDHLSQGPLKFMSGLAVLRIKDLKIFTV